MKLIEEKRKLYIKSVILQTTPSNLDETVEFFYDLVFGTGERGEHGTV